MSLTNKELEEMIEPTKFEFSRKRRQSCQKIHDQAQTKDSANTLLRLNKSRQISRNIYNSCLDRNRHNFDHKYRSVPVSTKQVNYGEKVMDCIKENEKLQNYILSRLAKQINTQKEDVNQSSNILSKNLESLVVQKRRNTTFLGAGSNLTYLEVLDSDTQTNQPKVRTVSSSLIGQVKAQRKSQREDKIKINPTQDSQILELLNSMDYSDKSTTQDMFFSLLQYIRHLEEQMTNKSAKTAKNKISPQLTSYYDEEVLVNDDELFEEQSSAKDSNSQSVSELNQSMEAYSRLLSNDGSRMPYLDKELKKLDTLQTKSNPSRNPLKSIELPLKQKTTTDKGIGKLLRKKIMSIPVKNLEIQSKVNESITSQEFAIPQNINDDQKYKTPKNQYFNLQIDQNNQSIVNRVQKQRDETSIQIIGEKEFNQMFNKRRGTSKSVTWNSKKSNNH